MLRRLWILPLAFALSGCAFNDCDFGDIDPVEGRGQLTADGSTLGDTLTVAFVNNPQSYETPLLIARGPYERTPARSTGETVELDYEVDGIDFGIDSPTARPLASVLRGDTLFVYIEGSLSPDLFMEVCSPPEPYLDVLVDAVRAPAQVRSVRLTQIYLDELVPETAMALRRSDAAAPRPVLTV